MPEQTTNELVNKIQYAFKKVKHPGKKIGEKLELSDWIDKEESSVTINDINGNWSLRLFSPQAVQYFLPVYLKAILQHPLEVGQNVKESVLQDLSGYDATSGVTQKLCEIFTEKQKQAVLEFLQRYREFFPEKTDRDIEQLPIGHRQSAKERDVRIRQLLQAAIHYWESC